MEILLSRERAARTTLQFDNWISEGLALLVEKGIDAVQITVLAKRLGVTRGSFYWHFENREELLDGLLAEWRARNSNVMFEAIADADSLESGVLELFAVWVDHARFDPKLDQAVRDWARHDPALHAKISEEDDARIAAIADFFERMSFEKTESFIRARVIYFTQLSYYALNVDEPFAERVGYLDAYMRTFTGRGVSHHGARDFENRMRSKK